MKNRMTKLEKQNRMKVLMLLKFLAQIKSKIGLLSLAREFEDWISQCMCPNIISLSVIG